MDSDKSFVNSPRALSLPCSSHGAETTKSHVPGASARMKSPNRVKSPFLAAMSRIAFLSLLVEITGRSVAWWQQ